MKKRFKTKKRSKNIILKLLFILLIIYISFTLIYNLIYNVYLSSLSNEEIIAHIIENTKNNKSSNSLFSKYQNPIKILDKEFGLKEEKEESIEVVSPNKEYIIYIYNTHETESYSDKYLEVYNIKPTVKTMDYILQDYLSDLGINSYIEENSITSILKEHNWSYKYSYDASREIIEPVIKSNNNLKLIIDLHRDSSPLSKTTLTIDNINYARILFVVGMEHSNYNLNLDLANKLNSILESELPGLSRGITQKSGSGVNGIYNQDLSANSVLIELGGQYNEIEELNNSLKVLSRVILKYLEGEQ